MPREEQADDIEQRFFSEADLLFVLVGDWHEHCNYVAWCPLANLDSLAPNYIFVHDQVADVEGQAKAVVATSGPLLFGIFSSSPSLNSTMAAPPPVTSVTHTLVLTLDKVHEKLGLNQCL